MKSVLKIVKLYYQIEKRFFKDSAPHWYKDLKKIFKYINIIIIIPTLAAIFLCPKHFYRRLPIILEGKNNLYATPLKFISNATILLLILLTLVAKFIPIDIAINKAQLIQNIILLSIFMPLIVMCLCFVFIILMWIVSGVGVNNSNTTNYNELKVPISPRIYSRLNLNNFGWSQLYYSIYIVLALPIWLVISTLLFSLASYILISNNESQSTAAGYLMIMTLGIVVIIGQRFFITPYIHLLKAAMIYPTKTIYKSDCYNLRRYIKILTEYAHEKGKGGFLWNMRLRFLSRINKDLKELINENRTRNFDLRNNDIKIIETFRNERKEFYCTFLKFNEMLSAFEGLSFSIKDQIQIEQIKFNLKQLSLLCEINCFDSIRKNQEK